MTGYAVTFNKRHKRSGHLFQNRYKSIVCEEDSYLLELIRYIHLNPLRAGLVKDLKELDRYPWTGHSAILGKRKNPLILKQQPNDFPFAGRRITFSQFRPEIEKATINPENPVDPACPVAPGDGTGVRRESAANGWLIKKKKNIDDITYAINGAVFEVNKFIQKKRPLFHLRG